MPGYCPDGVDCFQYSPPYTFLGSEPRLLIPHFIFSLFIGLIIMGILSVLKKKNKINWSYTKILLISGAIFVILFFLLAMLFPIRVMY